MDVNALPIHNIYVLDYINEFCSETVKELQLGLGELNYNLENFKKPFRAVEKLKCFFESTKYPAPEGDCLARLFPNIRTLLLRFYCSPLSHSGCVAKHFPELEILVLDIRSNKNCNTCKKIHWKHFAFKSTAKTLKIRIIYHWIVDFTEYLQNIEILEVCGTFIPTQHHSNLHRIHLKNVKHLTVTLRVTLPGQWTCNSIEHVHLR